MLSKLTCLGLEENRQHFQVFKKGKNMSQTKNDFSSLWRNYYE